jgi:hypothetical protein
MPSHSQGPVILEAQELRGSPRLWLSRPRGGPALLEGIDSPQRARRWRLAWPLLLVSLSPSLFVASATAAPPVAVAPAAAPSEEDLINRGIALREARNDGAALDAFREAYAVKKSPRALAQVALAEQALGRWVQAEVDLGQAIARADDAWIARNKPLLSQALAEIQGNLGSLQLTGGVAGAEVFVNGARAGTLPLAKPLRVNAGNATLEVRAMNYLPSTRTVMVPRRGIAREAVTLVATAAPPAVAPSASADIGGPAPALAPSPLPAAGEPDPHEGWSVRKKIGLAFGAAAVVSAAVGTTYLFVRDGRAQDFNNAGCGTEALTPPCSFLRDREETAVTWIVSGMVGAAVLGGVSAYLLLWPSGADPGRVARAESAAGFVRCTPSVSGGMSLTCGGRF